MRERVGKKKKKEGEAANAVGLPSHPAQRERIGGPRGTAADRGSEWWSCLREREWKNIARKEVEASSGRTGSTGPATGTEYKWGHLPRSLSFSFSPVNVTRQENERHERDLEMRR